MRVHELAKILDLSTNELKEHLQDLEMPVSSNFASLTDEQVAQVKDYIGFGDDTPAPPMESFESLLTEEESEIAAAQEEESVAVETEPEAGEAAPAGGDAGEAEDEFAGKESEEEAAAEDRDEPAEKQQAGAGDDQGEKTVYIKGHVLVKELATILDIKPNLLIAELMRENVFASISEKLDFKIAQKIASRHGIVLEKEVKKPASSQPPPVAPSPEKVVDTEEKLLTRAPVVTFMGHVDHGKTSLLDRIRSTRVAQGEAGGITQHIGAYTVEFQDHKITFLDTPGHAAFTAMRARGAQLTDIVVLIVAADDGIMPQTREAIQHAQAAGVCMIVAVNKCDLPGAQPDRARKQLQEMGLNPEDWGGDLSVVNVSAETGEGIDNLLESLVLESEMLELRANPNRPAEGFVVEARLEPGMGPTATVLVKRGTLKTGDTMVCGSTWGRVKALINDKGNKVRTAGPSDAVKCMGLNSVPEAGAAFEVYANDRAARAVVAEREEEARQHAQTASATSGVTLDDLFAKTGSQKAKKTLPVIIKCDVQGTLEAVRQTLSEIKSGKVDLSIVLTGVGNITVNDVLLAKASGAIIIGFSVSKESGVGNTAKREGVEIRLYSVIYELFDDVRRAMVGLLDPEYREVVTGHAEIRQVFEIGKHGKVAGCMVTDGRISARGRVRVKRGSEVLFEGRLASLKRFQNDAGEVREGQECGIGIDGFSGYDAGDVIECYVLEKLEISL